MYPGISKPKVSTNVDTSADISPSSEMESTSKSTRTCKSDTEVPNKTISK